MMFGGLFWYSVNDKERPAQVSFAVTTLAVFLALVILIWINLFIALFGAALVLSFALYISDREKTVYGKEIRNGAFGGLWLSMPVFIYLIANF